MVSDGVRVSVKSLGVGFGRTTVTLARVSVRVSVFTEGSIRNNRQLYTRHTCKTPVQTRAVNSTEYY